MCSLTQRLQTFVVVQDSGRMYGCRRSFAGLGQLGDAG